MYIDLFVIVVLLWGLFSGWRAGFIRELFNLLGAIVGLIVASVIYLIFHEYLGVEGSTVDAVLSIIAFFILAIILPIAIGFFCAPLTRFVKLALLGLPNSILGAVAGFLKFLLIISFAFNTLENLNLLDRAKVDSSSLYEPMRSVLGVVRNDVAEARAAHAEEQKSDAVSTSDDDDVNATATKDTKDTKSATSTKSAKPTTKKKAKGAR